MTNDGAADTFSDDLIDAIAIRQKTCQGRAFAWWALFGIVTFFSNCWSRSSPKLPKKISIWRKTTP